MSLWTTRTIAHSAHSNLVFGAFGASFARSFIYDTCSCLPIHTLKPAELPGHFAQPICV